MPRITSPKVHWTMVGYATAMRRMTLDAVTTGKPKIDAYEQKLAERPWL